MRLLLDTQVAIWAVMGSDKLPSRVTTMIEDQGNEVAVSMVSLWEIAVKNAPGRRNLMPLTLDTALEEFAAAEFAILPIEIGHLRTYGTLPPIHNDPFDRLLVATAIADTWRLVSADRALAAYGDVVIPA